MKVRVSKSGAAYGATFVKSAIGIIHLCFGLWCIL